MQKDSTMGFSLHHALEAGGEAPPSPCWGGRDVSKQKSVKKEKDFGGTNTLWPLQSLKGNMIYTRNGTNTELCQSPTRKQQAHSGWVTWTKGLSTKVWAGCRETTGIGQNLELVTVTKRESSHQNLETERKRCGKNIAWQGQWPWCREIANSWGPQGKVPGEWAPGFSPSPSHFLCVSHWLKQARNQRARVPVETNHLGQPPGCKALRRKVGHGPGEAHRRWPAYLTTQQLLEADRNPWSTHWQTTVSSILNVIENISMSSLWNPTICTVGNHPRSS